MEEKTILEETTAPATEEGSTLFDTPKEVTAKKSPKGTKKTWLTIVVILLIAALLVGAIFLIKHFTGSEGGEESSVASEESTEALKPLVDKSGKEDVSVISSVSIQNTTGSFEVCKNNEGVMTVKDYADLPHSSQAVETFLKAFLTITPSSIVSEKATNEEVSLCQLEDVTTHFSVTYTDGETFGGSFGSLSFTDDYTYYFMPDNDTHIYTVDATLWQSVETDPLSLLANTLLATPTAREGDSLGVATLIGLNLSGSIRDKDVSMRYVNANDSSSVKMACNLLITEPYYRPSSTSVTQSWDSELVSIVADNIVCAHPTQNELKKYGLLNPRSIGELTVAMRISKDEAGNLINNPEVYNKVTSTILLGKLDLDGDCYYAMLKGIDIVYLVKKDLVPWAELTYNDIVNDNLFLRYITDISAIHLTLQGKERVIDLKHDSVYDGETSTATLDATCDGKTMDTDTTRMLYRKLMMIQRLADAPEDVTIPATAELRINLTSLRADDPDITDYSFYPYSANRYLCKGNDDDLFLVKSSDIENLIQSIQKYLDGKTDI